MRVSFLRRVLSQAAATKNVKGIFGNDKLRSHADFEKVTDNVLKESNLLLGEILKPYEERSSKKASVHLLDDLSNTICTVADLVECVRNMHPDSNYRIAGNNSIYRLTDLLETLNSLPALYHAVARSEELESSLLDSVDRRALRLFLDDFEQCGIHLKEDQRKEFVRLSTKIFELGMKFSEQGSGCDNEYIKFNAEKEKTLVDLINHRQKLAKLTGFKSFADRAQQHTILGGYDEAVGFLELVTKKLKPILDEELEDVYRVAIDNKTVSSRAELSHSDVEMASRLRQQKLHFQYGDLSRFLRFGRILKGFNELCQDLYGVTLETSKPDQDEIWPGSVVKIQVSKATEFLGTIYIDACRRKSKTVGDCHYTVRCSKLLDDGTYQKPIVVLSLSFFGAEANIVDFEGLLDKVTLHPQHAENLFHELGHAIHSMLGATRYQHTAGTRCSTDFAEVPSNLMEFFFNDPRVLKRFCADPNGSLFTDDYAKAIHSSINIYSAHFHAQQILLALFDLQLHHADSNSPKSLYQRLHQHVFPKIILPADYAYHQGFTHLVTYGAKYYSYTIAKACASQIWQKHFEENPFSRTGGEHWAGVQARGGERPSAELLELALGTKLSVEDLAEAFRLYCHGIKEYPRG